MGAPAKFSSMGQVLAATMVLDGFATLAEAVCFDEGLEADLEARTVVLAPGQP